MTVLTISAHCDDSEIGAGGTLYKHLKNKDEIIIAVLNSDDWRCGESFERKIEQTKSAQILKARVLLFEGKTSAEEIISKLDGFRPNLIYLPYYMDSHQHHLRASQIGLSLTRKGSDFLYYNSGSALNFSPNFFSNIDWGKKKKLINCYGSQNGHMNFVESSVEGFIVGRLTWK